MWDGSDLNGQTLLIHAEQGLGDSIHFARFLPLIMNRGGRIILEVQAELVRLMKQMEILKGIEVVPRESKAGPKLAFDTHLPLMSLPWLLKKLNPTVDKDVVQPPYVKADATLVEQRRGRIKDNGRPKVGIAWAGSKTNKNDRHRSITLNMLAEFGKANVDLYNLQLGKPGEQAKTPPEGMELIDLTAMIGDFADTAALVEHLDLIVSVDTAVVHLAGAMTKPVWVMIQYTPDFRWLLNGETTPWYPSMRLFRQSNFGDYAEVIHRVAGELANYKVG
jgi:hypothetical protein